ncbi:hypothetical protein A2U01_0084374, partial [Trifolium medium]|nr:hypothetical protein [Trifolium medium]
DWNWNTGLSLPSLLTSFEKPGSRVIAGRAGARWASKQSKASSLQPGTFRLQF